MKKPINPSGTNGGADALAAEVARLDAEVLAAEAPPGDPAVGEGDPPGAQPSEPALSAGEEAAAEGALRWALEVFFTALSRAFPPVTFSDVDVASGVQAFLPLVRKYGGGLSAFRWWEEVVAGGWVVSVVLRCQDAIRKQAEIDRQARNSGSETITAPASAG